MSADPNVGLKTDANYTVKFQFSGKITSVYWLDNSTPVEYIQDGNKVTIKTEPYPYGRDLVVRVAKILCE